MDGVKVMLVDMKRANKVLARGVEPSQDVVDKCNSELIDRDLKWIADDGTEVGHKPGEK